MIDLRLIRGLAIKVNWLSKQKRRELSSAPFPSSSAGTNYFFAFLVGTVAIVCKMRLAIL
jgi:hypothetical protein